ncbi:metal dependent phosphohydrolase [Clostridium sp. CAG:354]|jgi:predicted HD superfamily hydrolase involved in NAD metabolism|nr:bis(5'-nucleosyl)-tetraphosphatase (symmetrical) YqeK [Clostridia bacterium]CDE11673.1 metal dependent phosphohydrolase [Clostridium sp. CAG:354]
MEYKEIENDVKSVLSEYRFTHSLGVAKKAIELAKIYGVQEEIAKKVGIAHDIAKEMTDEEMIEYAKVNNIRIDEIETVKPSLLHGKIGADIAAKKFGFTQDMINAIKWHTTGRENMSMLEKIIYVADKTEENRKGTRFNLEKSRELSTQNIDETLIFLMNEFITYNVKNEWLIHPETIKARNDLLLNEGKIHKN